MNVILELETIFSNAKAPIARDIVNRHLSGKFEEKCEEDPFPVSMTSGLISEQYYCFYAFWYGQN